MRSSVMSKVSLVAATVAIGLVTQAMGAVGFPYTNDFSSSASDFEAASSGSPTVTWSVTGGAYQTTFYDPTWGGSASFRAVQAPTVAGQNFTLSTNFTVLSKNIAGNDYIFGMSFLADSARQAAWSSDSFYMVAVRLGSGKPDTISLVRNDGAWGALLPTTETPQDAFGNQLGWTVSSDGTVQYTLAVTGTYAGDGSLVLAATLSGGANSKSLTTTSITSPKTGGYFGYHETGFGSGGSVDFDNFSVAAVPEPTSLALLVLSAAGLMARQRRSA